MGMRMAQNKTRRAAFLLAALAAAAPISARAWWSGAHMEAAAAAVRAPSENLPEFFRKGEGMIVHCSVDPDVIRGRAAPALRSAERSEHFIDLELLQGRPLPPTRYEYVRLSKELNFDPGAVGTLPYALMEWTQRLAFAFEEHRRMPDNPFIQMKALYIAGVLSHYAADMTNPLHCTIHFDGRANPDGSSPRTGIHAKVDGLPEKLGLTADDYAVEKPVEPFDDLFEGILAELESSRTHIDPIYADEEGALTKAFALDRMRAAAAFTARLFETAWSYPLQDGLPSWLEEARKADSY